MLIVAFILIVALGTALGLWFARHISFQVEYEDRGGGMPRTTLPEAA